MFLSKKPVLLFMILVFSALVLLSPVLAAGENLLENAEFQELDKDGLPEYWYTDAYYLDDGYSVFGITEGMSAGQKAISIRNIEQNDARFAQFVEVEPNSMYRLSGYIRAGQVEGTHGANFSIEGLYAFSEEVFDTDGEWQYIEYYGETGPDQDYIVVYARLGGYSGISTGRAAFTDISLTKVDSIPGDMIADLWYRESADSYAPEDDDEEIVPPFTSWLILISFVYLIASLSILYIRHQSHELLPEEKKISPVWIITVLISSLILRIVISWLVEGYLVDVNCFVSWGRTMAENGPALFYAKSGFCDYPPLYTYILGLNSLISSLTQAGTQLERIIFRFIPSLCDLAGCWLVYRLLIREKQTNNVNCFIFLLFALFNPAFILNSAAWGQMDSALCLILLAVVMLAVNGRWTTALPLYVVAVLVKPQALMLGPLGLIFILVQYFNHPDSRKSILAGTGIGVLTLAAGIVPFSLQQNWDWLIQLYKNTLESYPYATLNTANFYYLLGGNWNGVAEKANTAAPVLLSLFAAGYGIWICFRTQKKPRHMTEICISFAFSAAFLFCAFAGASWAWTGGIAMGYAFAIVLSPALRSRDIRILPWLGSLLYILLYVFGVKMHERYIFPALLLLAASWALIKDRRIIYILALFTFTTFINEGIVLDNSIRLGSAQGHLNSDTVWLADILSLINIAGAVYAVWLSSDICSSGNTDSVPDENRENGPSGVSDKFTLNTGMEKDFPSEIIPDGTQTPDEIQSTPSATSKQKHFPAQKWLDRSLHWKRLDTLLLAAITVAYAVLSLSTLGSTKAPQTYWTSYSADEEIVFDLGEFRDDFEVLYFARVSKNNFAFSVSDDGEHWEQETWAQMSESLCWKWRYVTLSVPGEDGKPDFSIASGSSSIVRFSGRYLKLIAHRAGLTLNEILVRDVSGNILPLRVIKHTGTDPDALAYSDPSAMTDEQDTMERLPAFPENDESRQSAAQPGWWNSTYFDEIYHARTGYEFLQGSVPYETSHPPLGKLLMSFCIAIFGMTPFGWRFAGAFAGILMLPGMYLLGKQLTKKTSIAVIACLLMALDCQHLTQTQIATIDSFPVLFIIFSFFFMLRFIQTDFVAERKAVSLLSLLFSGLFMGFSIASKWIGIYAGAGLAVLFFIHCFRILRKNAVTDRVAFTHAIKKTLSICLWCVLFFIVFPVIIYLMSYIPYFAYKSSRIHSTLDYIREVWNSQLGMYHYHSQRGFGADHPFSSPWWQWPIIGKPMYYAMHEYIPSGFTLRNSIYCFGNPAIWFGGLAGLAYCVARFVLPRRYATDRNDYLWHLKPYCEEPRFSFILIGFLAQYLPWVFVPRGTYIYHYFASVPFLILGISVCFDHTDPRVRKALQIIAVIFILAAVIFFILLFPYACGLNVSPDWLEIGRKILKVSYTY